MNNLLPIFVIGMAAVFLLFHLVPMYMMRKSKGAAAPDVSDLTGSTPTAGKTLYYFWNPRCGMCKSMTPVVQELAEKRENIVLVDTSQQLEIAQRFGVMGTPAMVIVNNGTIEKVLLGAKSHKKIESLLS